MVELMAILIIIGLLATVVVTKVASKIDQARITTTKANLKILHSAVNQFKMDTGRFPTEELGLLELIEQPTDVINWEPGGYLETTELPLDGWGNEFKYELYPESGKQFVIRSFGPDGEEGTEDDLLSTDAN
jgi:general secretion pathway protein G